MSIISDLRGLIAPRTDAAPAPIEARSDGWENVRTGMGVAGVDASTQTTFDCAIPNRSTLTNLYRCGGIAAKIIERPALDSTREWIEYVTGETDEEAAEFNEGLQDELKRLNAQQVYTQAIIWARLYGAGMILVHFDGEDSAEPLPEGDLPLRRITRLEVRPGGWNSCFWPIWDDNANRSCANIIGYRYQPSYGPAQTWDASRVIRIDQTMLPEEVMLRTDCWGDGVIPRLWDSLKGEGTAFASSTQYLSKFQYSVWKIKGLMSKIAGGSLEALRKRYQLAIYGRSFTNAIALDMGQEELEDRTLTVGGLAELLDRYPQRVSAVASMPMTLLYQTSPGGLNATGDSDIRLYYDFVAATIQQFQLRPALEYLTDLLLRQIDGPSGGSGPDRWKMDFLPLWQMSDLEQAQLRHVNAQADVAYVNSSVLMPEEVAESRFGSAEYGRDIDLDDETRALMAEEPVVSEEPEPMEDPDADADS